MVEPNSKGGYNLRKRKKKDVADDMVSGLPDEILVSILSLLPLKEAQATSILSRRWQYLWAYSTNLNFDGEKNLMRLNELKGEACELEMCRYVNWVDSVLKQHRALNIERFRVFFKLGPRICIDEWIQFAMRKGVQVLELDFSAYIRYLLIGKYRFSNKLLGISETSGLKSLCSEYIGFKCLKVFDLKSVDVDQEVLEYFISNCPVLERLVVYGSSSLVNLRVVGHSIALKYLVIRRCENIKTIQICDANLVSFCYDGYVRNLVLSNLPLLVEVSIVGWLPHDFLEITFFHLSCCLSQLEILNLNYMKALSQSWSKKSPFAKKTAAKCSHDRLKVVEIVGYSGLSRQIELVMYLTKTASNLEKIVFDSVNSWRPRFDRLRDLVVEKEELSRAQALQLKRKLPATLEVVCL
ncbi:putative F-box protein At3g58860 isoform X2 [Rosa chinensis]|uniref:putative F-box protein At3g58860 isoform X2 n=1 Tax=Rosa chinensis TaxID=74649 RepID=UPI000D095538|nr:putative F-box protein At3g58860 isoform X2 [Rosa chinensis]